MSTRISNGKAGPFIDLAMYLAVDLSELSAPLKVEVPQWSYGTSANQINVIFADKVTLSHGDNKTLDLNASVTLLDIFNRALTMTALKFLYIHNRSSDANLKILGGVSADIPICASNTDIVIVKPGGDFIWRDPSATGLVITTNKNLKLEHDSSGESSMIIDVIAMGLD